MKIKVIFQKTEWDGALSAWLDMKEVEIEVSDELKGYHVVGGIVKDDNSSGEYVKGAVKISFCPLCGRKLSGASGSDDTSPNTDEFIEKFKERLSPEEFEKFKSAAYEFGKSLGVMFGMIERETGDGENGGNL